MSGEKARAVRHDALQILKLGLAVDAAAFLALFVIGMLVKGFAAAAALQIVRSGLFILGALSLLVVAGLLLVGDRAHVRDHDAWCKRFAVAGLLPVAAGLAVLLLASAVALDYLLFYL